jgi:hypothetical protein
VQKPKPPPEYISSKQLATDHGIDAEQQLRLVYDGKLTGYRLTGKLQPFFPSMNPPYAGCKNLKPYPVKVLPDGTLEGKPLPGSSKLTAEYRQIHATEAVALNKDTVTDLYYNKDEVAAIEPVQEKRSRRRSGSKDELYHMLDHAIADYYKNTKTLPSDPSELDREIWSYPAVVKAKKNIGIIDHKSLKAGLRRCGLGTRLPKLPGGRGKKAVK